MKLPTRISGTSPINEHFQGEDGSLLEGKLSGFTQVHQPTILITEDSRLKKHMHAWVDQHKNHCLGNSS